MKANLIRVIVLLVFTATALQAQVLPQLINYKGRIASNGVNFDGTGRFKFALVDTGGTVSYWSNDGTSTAGGEPGSVVTLTVTDGQYSVLLGDSSLPNMSVIPPAALDRDVVLLRVWFDDGISGSQRLSPDHNLRDECLSLTGDAWRRRDSGIVAPHVGPAVWTGTEMIMLSEGTNDVTRYNPSTNSWKQTVAAGERVTGTTIVWTGREILTWDSSETTKRGGRYDPLTDRWTAISTTGAPAGRGDQAPGVWTGSELIVWGGGTDDGLGFLKTGGRYNPTTDRWTAMSTIDAPVGRWGYTAVWTGSEFIIWGGADGNYDITNTGGRYNPATNRWSPVTDGGVPAARRYHSAVWTGSEMIVWGGEGVNDVTFGTLNTGGRYNPVNNTWRPMSPSGGGIARHHHTAIWTGSEMIIYEGWTEGGTLQPAARYHPGSNSWKTMNTAGFGGPAVWTGSELIVVGGNLGHARYNPVSDRWTPFAPTHADLVIYSTGIWTGSEMIVWNGHIRGGRYDPTGNYSAMVSTVRAPSRRRRFSTVWTGSEMIVWGGADFLREGPRTLNTGGRYNPVTNSWTPTTTIGAPAARASHSAVWTGTEMIVWGGQDGGNTGGRYTPATDTWSDLPTNGAPTSRSGHSAVWTGSEMVVWGGVSSGDSTNTGGRYNPATDAWSDLTTNGAPVAQSEHTALWTGSEMIVWGGRGLDDSASYDPAGDRWTPLGDAAAIPSRTRSTAVWTGTEMMVFGETSPASKSGGHRYNPTNRSWTEIATGGFVHNAYHVVPAVWTGKEVIRWNGIVGERYFPAEDRWSWIASNYEPPARVEHTGLWTGNELIVWGGRNSGDGLSGGGRYHPAQNRWETVNSNGSLGARTQHSAVWTGSEMIVWGGSYGGGFLNDGARYDPAGNNWTPVNLTGAPSGRSAHTAVWTGQEMIIWGGRNGGGFLNDGARYQPSLNAWVPVSTAAAPAARSAHTSVWTGSDMIVWGGEDAGYRNDGGRYRPSENAWSAVSPVNAPAGRTRHTAVWTGSDMIVWGGYDGSSALNDGGRYRATENTWTALNAAGAQGARQGHSAVWTGNEMIVWGGMDDTHLLNTGSRYRPEGDLWKEMTTLFGPAARRSHSAVWTGSEMLVWGGEGTRGFYNDTFSYLPDCGTFRITGIALDGENLQLTFSSVTGRLYTLWRSDALVAGSWSNTGLPAMAGSGGPLTFTVPGGSPGGRYFRVQEDR